MNEEIVSVDAYAVQCTCTVYCTLYNVKVAGRSKQASEYASTGVTYSYF